MAEQQMAYHWLSVGYVSPRAEADIKQRGGQVFHVSSVPSLVAVAIAYDERGTWQWRKGKRQYRHGLEFWSGGDEREVQEASTGLNLLWGCRKSGVESVEYASVDLCYLIMPDEEFDVERGEAKVYEVPVQQASDTSWLNELDEHPF